MNARKKLGDLLITLGFLTREDLQHYLDKQKELDMKLGDILVNEKVLTKEQLAAVLEFQLDVPVVDLSKFVIDARAPKTIAETIARRYCAIPVSYNGTKLVVAMADPFDFIARDDIRLASECDLEIVMSAKTDILKMIDMHYDSSETVAETFKEMSEFSVSEEHEETVESEEVANSPVVRLVNSIISRAVKTRASDIHIEPSERALRVRYRLDGDLKEVMSPPKASHAAIVARIKILGGMDISEKRIPQDGRIETEVDGRQVDLRISILPTVYGEKIVIRLLDRSSILVSKEKIGFTPHNVALFDRIMKAPEGIILLTGPTGSGKTTTLYAALKEINKPNVNIITTEDPVEYRLDGVNQVQINEKAGMTFAASLRSILRQDPDVVMVGEIRDSETAQIAMRAAITGHVVLSTLHTNDTVSTISRLVDMGIEPFMVASALVGIVAQRLVKRICTMCREKADYSEEELASMGLQGATIYRGKGCNNCGNTGYAGRIAIHEVLVLEKDIKNMVIRGVSSDVIKDAAVQKGMKTLNESCKELIYQGVTTPEELMRVAYSLDQ